MSSALPPGWAWIAVGDLVSASSDLTDGPFGSNLKTEHYRDSGPRVVRLQNIGDGRFLNDEAHISTPHFARLRKHEVLSGDVIVAMLGSDLPRACLAPSALGPAIVKADCVRLRPDARITSGRYAVAALNSPAVRRQAEQLVHGVGRPRLGLKWFRDLRVPLAPVPEQARLLDALDSCLTRLDAAVASLEAAERKLKAYRASVLKAAVEGRLVPTEAELARREGRSYEPADVLLERILDERRRRWEEAEFAKMKAAGKTPKDDKWKAVYAEPSAPKVSALSSLPEGWCWATTAQLFSFVTSGSRGWAQYYSESGPLFIRIGNLDHDSISLDLSEAQHVSPKAGAEGTRTRVAPGDVLVSITADVGMIALVPDEIGEAYINQHVGLARPVNGLNASYVAWFLAAAHGGQRQFSALQRGATKVGLGLDDIRSVLVPIPPLAEQSRIVDEVERRFSVAADCESTVTANQRRIRRLRQSILHLALQGRLVDQDPADEPADVLLARIRAERVDARAATPTRKGAGKSKRGAA